MRLIAIVMLLSGCASARAWYDEQWHRDARCLPVCADRLGLAVDQALGTVDATTLACECMPLNGGRPQLVMLPMQSGVSTPRP